jgi:hypothetical protein
MINKNRDIEEKINELKLSGENMDYELEELDKEITIQSSIRDSLMIKKMEQLNKLKDSSEKQNNNIFSEKNKINNKNFETIDQFNDLNFEDNSKKLSNFVTKNKSCLIVDFVINDFKILKKKFEKQVKSSFIETILVKFEPLDVYDSTPINVRVTSDNSTILDLLGEVCSIHGLNYKNFDLYDKNGNKIPLIQTVKRYLNNNPEAKFNRFVCLKKKYTKYNLESIESQINLKTKKLNNDEKNFDQIKLLCKDLILAEDTAIKKFKHIIFYFFLLVCLFTDSLNKFGIQQKYFIDSAVNKNIYKKRFFSNNINELHNSFENVINSELLYEWFFKVYLNIFEFKGKLILNF